MKKLKFLIISAVLIGSGLSVNAASAHEAKESAHEAGEGASVLRNCLSCHSIVEGKNRHGPSLFGVVGRVPGTMNNFKYSPAMTAFGEAGNVWNVETLRAYLKNSRKAVPGTRMAFPGIKDKADLEDLLDYLETLKAE